MREIINGIFYVMRAGCPWRLVPSDLPPWGTIYRWFGLTVPPFPVSGTPNDGTRRARGCAP